MTWSNARSGDKRKHGGLKAPDGRTKFEWPAGRPDHLKYVGGQGRGWRAHMEAQGKEGRGFSESLFTMATYCSLPLQAHSMPAMEAHTCRFVLFKQNMDTIHAVSNLAYNLGMPTKVPSDPSTPYCRYVPGRVVPRTFHHSPLVTPFIAHCTVLPPLRYIHTYTCLYM